MAFAVWKKLLSPSVSKIQTITVPVGATFLHADRQHGDVAVWFQCDPQNTVLEERELIVLPTGGTIFPDEGDLRYLGTPIFYDGNLVLHVFEVRR